MKRHQQRQPSTQIESTMSHAEPTTKERIALLKEQIRLHAEISKPSFSVAPRNMLPIPSHPTIYPNHYEAIYSMVRARVSTRLIEMDPAMRPILMSWLVEEDIFPSDYNLERWHSEVAETIRGDCRRNRHINHAEVQVRSEESFTKTPNAQSYTYVDKTISIDEVHYCLCAPRNTIMLCNNTSHMHCADAKRSFINQSFKTDEYRDRLVCGELNQNIVACNLLGACGSNERWTTLIGLVGRLVPVHGSELCNLFDSKLSREEKWKGPRSCLASFMYSSLDERALGKRGDRDFSLLPHTRDRLVRSRDIAIYESKVHHAQYLDLYHPHHARVDSRNACALTLALIAFVEATDSTIWLEIWELWCRLVRAHIRATKCFACKRTFAEGMAFVVLCCSITEGGVSYSFFGKCESFLEMIFSLNSE